MKIPLAIKLIIITIAIVLGVTLQITQKSAEKFEETAASSEQSANIALATSKSKEVENILINLKDKTKVLASLLKNEYQSNKETKEFDLQFNHEPNLYSLEIKKFTGTRIEPLVIKYKEDTIVKARDDKENLSKYVYDKEFIKRAHDKFPEGNIIKGEFVIKNTSIKIDPTKEEVLPVLSIGFLFMEESSEDDIIGNKYYVVADYSLSVLQKTFSNKDARIFFMVDKWGELLAHQNENMVLEKKSMLALGHDLVKEAFQAEAPAVFQKKYSDFGVNTTEKVDYRGAYVKNAFGTTIIAQIPESIIKDPGSHLLRESFKIMGQILSVAIFLIFLFSNSISSPIEKLVELTQQISKGNFDVNASKQVHSIIKDEVADLAKSFDNMTAGLKERDKVKNLFSKFHGSKVAEDLLNKDIGIGGQNKEVVVFFSDIRGFTAFSEKRPPEEVVEMLNEYFGAMVKIINTYNGVVDKFIGDAIMAIWGAPKGTPQDAENAVRACLEMRKALQELNEKRIARKQPPINIGMGLHAGRAISGTIGSNERMEYTVIGNTINTGSRIEASTKAFGADLLISDEVVSKIGDKFLLEMAGAAEVKGRSEALKLYKVRGFKDPATGSFVEVKTPYSDYEPEKADKVKVSA